MIFIKVIFQFFPFCDTKFSFISLIRFIYSGKLEVECWTEAVDLLSAAFKYKITDLIQKCGRFLEDIISPTNVCYIYNKASSCSVTTLQDKCLKLILDAGFMVLRSSAFELLSKDCVMDVVSSSDLNIDSELIVFETLLRWARLECCRTGQPTTEANILSELKPFLQHVCVDDMSDADKSALPPSVLSCVKPNNRNRIGFSVPESLLLYSQCFELEMSQNCSDFVGENFSCLRFSIDSSLHLIGLRFTAVSVNPPLNLAMTLIKENNPKATMFMYNVLETSWVQILRQNQNIWYSSEILLKQPIFLKSGDIYCLSINSYAVKCPRTTISSNILRLSNGPINFTVHSEDIWGITGLIFI